MPELGFKEKKKENKTMTTTLETIREIKESILENTTYGQSRKIRSLLAALAPVTKGVDHEGKHYVYNQYGQPISRVSERYTLIQNADLVWPLVKHFGIEKLHSIHRNGSSYFFKFDMDEQYDIGRGDLLRKQFIVGNSYNKTRCVRGIAGFFRLVCSNGMFQKMRGYDLKRIHVGEINVNEIAQNMIEASKQEYDISFWRKLNKIDLSLEEKQEAIKKFDAFDVKKKHSDSDQTNYLIRSCSLTNARTASGFDHANPLTAWGLYNNINWGIARSLNNMPKIIQANAKLDDYMKDYFSIN